MMKIKLVCVGKTTKGYHIDSEKEYLKRLKHYLPTEKVEIPDIKNVKNLSKQEINRKEGELILKQIQSNDQVILLDENGKSFDSVGFSKYLQQRINQGGKSIVFVVGGAYGFSEEVYARCDGKISLSPMTFSHQMVRSFFLEQLYRAFTILKGEPYHHQ